MSYYCDKYPIIEKKSISRDTFSITIYAPEAAKAAHAGQFANISAPGFTLRRPISICEFSRSRGTLRFVFEVRGKGTEAISRLNVGDNLDVLGPLGNGFAIPDSARRAVLVGGGIGVPPMLGLAKKLGDRATAILGFRDYSRIILADEPTGNLDSTNGNEVMSLLKELNRDGATVVMVTHSEENAREAERIIRMMDGYILTESKNIRVVDA